jgi:peptidoglycan/LPS O-acetylase OafA/YrhL
VVAGAVLGLRLNYLYIATSFAFIRNFFETATGNDHLTTHFWSLAVEEQFYLIFPIILWASLRWYTVLLLAILAFSVSIDGISFYLRLVDEDFMRFVAGPITEFQGIAVGSLTAIVLFKRGVPWAAVGKAKATIGLMALILLATCFEGPFINDINALKCLLFAGILVINLHHDANPVFRLLNSRWMMFIGVLSYSVYVWQQPFTIGLASIHKLGFMRSLGPSPTIDVLIAMASMAVLAAVSYLSYAMIERRFLTVREHFR